MQATNWRCQNQIGTESVITDNVIQKCAGELK